ncbi:hypothetical protein CHS0354_001898 [Potamilus streckersoni]|uniref:Transmembrane protein 242 n=1 Tax=Potamilus streckersoni TaxID=2493646 RepID=A0AAE0SYE3_9BIVA|nr:hypothetical protein CHS0354_001898 [Potamilus streckersoni]
MAAPMRQDDQMAADERKLSFKESKKIEKLKGGIFLASITGIAILSGFGMTLAIVKKKEPSMFVKRPLSTKDLPESGGSLAMRALAWGTLYSVTGFSLFCYATWKLLGVHNLKEFNEKIQSFVPKVQKKEPQGRSEFKNIRDLFEYIIEEDEMKKKRGT